MDFSAFGDQELGLVGQQLLSLHWQGKFQGFWLCCIFISIHFKGYEACPTKIQICKEWQVVRVICSLQDTDASCAPNCRANENVVNAALCGIAAGICCLCCVGIRSMTFVRRFNSGSCHEVTVLLIARTKGPIAFV